MYPHVVAGVCWGLSLGELMIPHLLNLFSSEALTWLGFAMLGATFLVQAGVFKGLTLTTQLPGWAAAGAANLSQMILTFLAMQLHVFRHRPENV